MIARGQRSVSTLQAAVGGFSQAQLKIHGYFVRSSHSLSLPRRVGNFKPIYQPVLNTIPYQICCTQWLRGHASNAGGIQPPKGAAVNLRVQSAVSEMPSPARSPMGSPGMSREALAFSPSASLHAPWRHSCISCSGCRCQPRSQPAVSAPPCPSSRASSPPAEFGCRFAARLSIQRRHQPLDATTRSPQIDAPVPSSGTGMNGRKMSATHTATIR